MLTLGGLALCLAVVMWGAAYKMAEYPEEGCAFRVMAPAKLLTKNERPVLERNLRSVLAAAAGQRPSVLHLPPWIAYIRPSALQTWPSRALVPTALLGNADRPELTYFSFRPPPSRSTS
jgi:hypothetical protein